VLSDLPDWERWLLVVVVVCIMVAGRSLYGRGWPLFMSSTEAGELPQQPSRFFVLHLEDAFQPGHTGGMRRSLFMLGLWVLSAYLSPSWASAGEEVVPALKQSAAIDHRMGTRRSE
jgi:hypothetical protein